MDEPENFRLEIEKWKDSFLNKTKMVVIGLLEQVLRVAEKCRFLIKFSLTLTGVGVKIHVSQIHAQMAQIHT